MLISENRLLVVGRHRSTGNYGLLSLAPGKSVNRLVAMTAPTTLQMWNPFLAEHGGNIFVRGFNGSQCTVFCLDQSRMNLTTLDTGVPNQEIFGPIVTGTAGVAFASVAAVGANNFTALVCYFGMNLNCSAPTEYPRAIDSASYRGIVPAGEEEVHLFISNYQLVSGGPGAALEIAQSNSSVDEVYSGANFQFLTFSV